MVNKNKERIEDMRGIPIDNQDIDNKDIVIAMIQSVSMKSYPDSLFDSFGLSVYDEVHHLSSEVFSNCLKKCNTLYSYIVTNKHNNNDNKINNYIQLNNIIKGPVYLALFFYLTGIF